MTASAAHEDGAIKHEDWAGEMGAKWLANLSGFEATIAPIGDALLTHAAFKPGERVVDIGFGGGATSLAIARAVMLDGEVLGIDISPDLVAATTRRAADANIANARFICADAATVTVTEQPFDRLTSRFGCMFFAEPVHAFANLRKLLKPNGRIDLAVWGPSQQNLWIMEGMTIARHHIDLPPPVPRAPGPFAFEEPDYMQDILAKSGFKSVTITPHKGQLPVGGAGATPAEAVAFARHAFAFGKVMLEYPQEVQEKIDAELSALYTNHHEPDAGVMMNYHIWLVSAQA